MSDEVIRSQLPNDNYRKGWDETFGKKRSAPLGRLTALGDRTCPVHNLLSCETCAWMCGMPSEEFNSRYGH